MKRIITLTIITTLIGCKETKGSQRAQEEKEPCDCYTVVQNNISGSWNTDFVVDAGLCEFDGDTTYHSNGINREITTCK